MEYLQSNGIPFGENGIVHTTARHRRTYYMSETKRNSILLSDYKKSIVK